MNGERRINVDRNIVGDFEIIAAADGFTLSEIGPVTERYGSVGAIIFRSPTLAGDIARLLSLSFKDDVTGGEIRFGLGDIGYAEVIGGKNRLCRLFKWDEKGQKLKKKPFLVARTRVELEEGLLGFLRDQNGDISRSSHFDYRRADGASLI